MSDLNKKFPQSKHDQIVRLNQDIRCPNIRIVGENRIISNSEAQFRAKQSGLDLVEVNFIRDKGIPLSICKLMDYGKFLYEKKRSEKLAAKKSRNSRSELKLIRFHITLDDADLIRKCNKIKELILEGYRVVAEIFFRGREQDRTDFSNSLMNKIIESVKDAAMIEVPPKYEGRTYSCTFKKIK